MRVRAVADMPRSSLDSLLACRSNPDSGRMRPPGCGCGRSRVARASSWATSCACLAVSNALVGPAWRAVRGCGASTLLVFRLPGASPARELDPMSVRQRRRTSHRALRAHSRGALSGTITIDSSEDAITARQACQASSNDSQPQCVNTAEEPLRWSSIGRNVVRVRVPGPPSTHSATRCQGATRRARTASQNRVTVEILTRSSGCRARLPPESLPQLPPGCAPGASVPGSLSRGCRR